MNEIKRFASVVLIVMAVYLGYYFQDEIVSFVKSPLDSITKNGQDNNTSETPNEKVKIQILPEEEAVIRVVENSSEAVVSIVKKEAFFDPFRGSFISEDSIGTGFIIDGNKGIVLTNKHVVASSDAQYSILMGEGEKNFEVESVYRDPINDFAILKINTNDEKLPELRLGDSDSIKVGQTVVAIGNALGQFGNSVTKGIISGLGRGIFARSSFYGPAESLPNVIQTDAALNPGNSGGPLINLDVEVIGINVAISSGAENIGFSIPINTLKPVIEDFKETGKISRPFLGVEYDQVTKEVSESQVLPVGAFVRRVVEDSPADKAGIKVGDIIIKIDGVRLDDTENTLANIIVRQEVGKTIEIIVDRNGSELSLSATLVDYGDLE